MKLLLHKVLLLILLSSLAQSIRQQIDDTSVELAAQDYLDALYGVAPESDRAINTSNSKPPTSTSASTPLLPLHLNQSLPNPTEPTTTVQNYTGITPLSDLPQGNDSLEFRSALVAVTNSTEQTPYSDTFAYNQMKRENGLLPGAPCLYYGHEVKKRQENSDEFVDDGANDQIKYTKKKNDDDFQKKVCKLSLRLECVRDRYLPVAPQPPTSVAAPGEPEADPVVPGTCRCLRGLSDRAVFVPPDKNNKKFKAGCYIPAGFAHSSSCGHVVAMPNGMFRTVGRDPKFSTKDVHIVRRDYGNTTDLCVPYSECRISSTYVGTRCMCIKDTKWHEKDGTCEKIWTRIELEALNNEAKRLSPLTSTVIILLATFYCMLGALSRRFDTTSLFVPKASDVLTNLRQHIPN